MLTGFLKDGEPVAYQDGGPVRRHRDPRRQSSRWSQTDAGNVDWHVTASSTASAIIRLDTADHRHRSGQPVARAHFPGKTPSAITRPDNIRVSRVMILLSNGGTNIQRAAAPSDTILVGTVDGVALLGEDRARLDRQASRPAGRVRQRVTALDDGTLFAATRGVGVARSDDGGIKWTWVNEGLAHHEFWSAGPASCRAATWCSSVRCRRISTSARTRASPGAS